VALSRFLCTTAIESTWPADRPVLFLGEWCRRHARRESWSKLDAIVMPYHWDDRRQLQTDYQWLLALHERLLVELAGQLNRIHGVSHGVRYWRILIGPWLGYFVQMVFDRWSCIEQSVLQHNVRDTIVLIGSELRFVPNNMADFESQYLGDEWNHHIYSCIVRGYFPQVSCVEVPREVAAGSSPIATPSWGRRARTAIAQLTSAGAQLLSRDRDAFFLATYLPPADEARLQLALKQVPQRWRSVQPVEVEVDSEQRQWRLAGSNTSGFEACVRELIPAQLPVAYLEGYTQLVSQVQRLPWPREPQLIFTSNSAWTDDVFKAYAGERVSAGSPLILGQHGGHLGTGRWSFVEDHEVAISDRYLSWGWSDSGRPNIVPTCQLKARRPLGVRHSQQSGALLVTVAFPRFSYWMYSAIIARQWLDYFEDQCSFVAHLPTHIREVLTVRLYRQDFGWDQVARWRERAADLRLDQGESTMDDLIRTSRIYISTYNATTFLESITMDVPTVIYWNPNHWELRDSAIEYFEDLRRVGVFHDTPQSAALHISRVWDDIDAWWLSPEVRDVLERFKFRYCRLVDDVPPVVQSVFQDVLAAPRMGAVQ
jgi:putative transferase (TIGR04331 family)